MAELTPLEEKIAEVLGLAQAAQDATKKVEGLSEHDELRGTLQRMRQEAVETEERCTKVAESREGKKTAMLDKARETKSEAKEMMQTYLSGEDTDELDGFEFLIMAEAGELGHVEVIQAMNEKLNDAEVRELVEFVLPIQQRHVEQVRAGALELAREEAEES
jgi:hypothetical protein